MRTPKKSAIIFPINRLFAVFIIATLIIAVLPSLSHHQGLVDAQGDPYRLTTTQIQSRVPRNVTPASNGWRLGKDDATYGYEEVTVTSRADNPDALLVSSYGNTTPRPLEAPSEPQPDLARPMLAPQTVGTSFTSVVLDDLVSGLVPPDTMGAVGPTQWITTVNGYLRSHNKTTGAPDGVIDIDDDTWWNIVKTPVGGAVASVGISDPRIRYDRITGRWFIIIIDIPFDSGGSLAPVANRVLVSYSDGPVITGSTVWTFAYFKHDTTLGSASAFANCFLDYPSLSVDSNAIMVGANMFCPSFAGSGLWVIDKDSLLTSSGNIASITHSFGNQTSTNILYMPHGADDYNPVVDDESWAVAVDNNSFGLLRVCRITNADFVPGVSSPAITCTALTVLDTRFPVNVPHPAGGTSLDAIDDRLMAAHIRDGRIWTSHNIGVNASGVGAAPVTRTATRWYEINASTTPTLIQAGTVFDGGASGFRHYWMGSIMVSGQGHAALGFTTANSTTNPSAATVGRLASDALGTTQGTPVIYQPGLANYPTGSGRWGDYSMTALDPCDDMTMYTIQEFSGTPVLYTIQWATSVATLLAPPPAVPFQQNAASGQAALVVNLTGDTSGGRGYYDTVSASANADACNINLDVQISGGVTLNSFTWVNASTISLNLNTTAAVPGDNPIITITNPDGQQVVADCWLNIDGAIPATCAGASFEIDVQDELAAAVPDGGSSNFGSTPVGSPVTKTYTVTNNGASALTLSTPISVPTGFTLTSSFGSTTLAPAQSTTFSVRCDAPVQGSFTGEVSFGNNDPDENPYNFTVNCTATGSTTVVAQSVGMYGCAAYRPRVDFQITSLPAGNYRYVTAAYMPTFGGHIMWREWGATVVTGGSAPMRVYTWEVFDPTLIPGISYTSVPWSTFSGPPLPANESITYFFQIWSSDYGVMIAGDSLTVPNCAAP